MMRRRALVLLAAAAASLAIPRSATAASRPSNVIIDGAGFGHGRGLSQWGAYALGARGVRWNTILSRYYSGTSISSVRPSTPIRVRVAKRSSVIITSSAPFRVSWSGGRATARDIRVGRRGSGLVVETRTSRGWTRAAYPRVVSFAAGRARLGVVRLAGGIREYRGSLEVRPYSSGVAVVDTVRLDDYLIGVVPSETPASWPLPALQAQAVAARTYAVSRMNGARRAHAPWDICDDTSCQVYGGAAISDRPRQHPRSLENGRTNTAVHTTAGRVVVWRGHVISAQYSSSSGGWTASGGTPYLRAVSDPADAGSPYHRWRVNAGAHTFETRFPIGRFTGVRVLGRDGRGPWGGRVVRVAVYGTRRTVVVGGDRFASIMHLRSSLFSLGTTARYVFTSDLEYGMRSEAVRQLQLRLRAERVYPAGAPVTGFFGPITHQAVRRYQARHFIRTTGYVGPVTRGSLNGGS
jgi:stage II sporulation protein D